MKDALTPAEVRERLETACEKAGSKLAWATDHNITPSTVSQVLNGMQPPPIILKALGLKRVYYYVPITGGPYGQGTEKGKRSKG